jgi:predicted dehydrogenase
MSAQLHLHRAAERTLRLGFVGLGWIGRTRLETIAQRDDVQVEALFDLDSERLEAAHTQYPQACANERFDELLAVPLDGIVIATPNALHAEQAIACLERGVPVFCQKPLGINALETRRIIDVAQRANQLLAVDYSYRHVRGMRELKERIHAGVLGEILAIDLEFHNAYAPNKQWCFDRQRSGGGCLLDLGVHLVDLALWLQDVPETSVARSTLFAQGRRARPIDVEDLAFLELQQANGAIVRIACSWNAQTGADALIGMQIHGTQGGAAWRNIEGSFLDFDLWVHRGNSRELLGLSLNDWGPGALCEWIARLQHDRSFDSSTSVIAECARIVDEAYRA